MNKIFYIAEIGINHNGDISIAKELIKKAKDSGFDSVKFQKRTINKVYSKELLDQPRESPWGKTQRDQKMGLEFSYDEYLEIDKYCKSLNIDWFASAWDVESVIFLDQFDLKYHKIASPMIVDINFLEEVAKRNLHTFISTGMSTVENIDKAVDIFKSKNCSFELMHCVSTYPLKAEDANLKTISSLMKKYNCNVGYSGHENGVAVSIVAATLGITSLERHVTLDRTMYGSDQAASLEPRGMMDMITGIKKALLAIGEDKLGYITEEEKVIAKKLRQHINI
jgi:N-acetylneuraminate synthase